MQHPTLLEGMAVALGACLVASPVWLVLRLWLGTAMAWKAFIVLLAFAYIVYLLGRRGKVTGRVTCAALSVLTCVASLCGGVSGLSVCLIAMVLIWSVRAAMYGRSLTAALLHGGLCVLGLGAALWAYANSGSLTLATWGFFLTQALCACIPPRLTQARTSVSDGPGSCAADAFVQAHHVAQQALHTWRGRTMSGV